MLFVEQFDRSTEHELMQQQIDFVQSVQWVDSTTHQIVSHMNVCDTLAEQMLLVISKSYIVEMEQSTDQNNVTQTELIVDIHVLQHVKIVVQTAYQLHNIQLVRVLSDKQQTMEHV